MPQAARASPQDSRKCALGTCHDAIFADRLNHACLTDGALLSRAAFVRYRHADPAHVEHALAASDARRKLIVTDAVFSMDGDIAPLPELLRLADAYDAWLVVDDAHGFGVLGDKLFMVTLDAHLLALDMKTGAIVWDVTMENYKNGYAATIASGLHGITNKVEAPPVFEGNAYESKDAERVPSSLHEAVDEMERSEVMREQFGDYVFGHLLNMAKQEQIIFDNQTVTDWELARYFERG